MTLRGGIDQFGRDGVAGWAWDDGHDGPLRLVVTVNEEPVDRVVANLYREDLERAGIGGGRHGFSVCLTGLSPLVPNTVAICLEGDGRGIPGTPLVIPRAPRFDEEVRDHLACMLADAESDEELARRAAFLAQQADRLLQLRADRRGRDPGEAALRQFGARWSGRTPGHAQRPRALVIDDRMPDESRDAGSRAIVSHMTSLGRLGFSVCLAPAAMGGGDATAMAAMGISCYQAPWCASVEEVLRREAGRFDLVYIHRVGNARYLPLVRHYVPRAQVVYSVADLHHLRLSRQAEVEQRPELLAASDRVRRAELFAAAQADCVITHSSHEAAMLRSSLPRARIHVVPWSVPVRPTAVPFAQRRGLAFIGSYDHAPNLDAAWWLIQEIMPAIRAQDPSLECLLVGSNMPDELRAAVSPGVRPIGHVDDLAGLFDQVRLTVAPLNFGAGVKGKLLDSWAAGIPCASTPIATEGLEIPARLGATRAESAAAMAGVVLRLHEDQAFNASCAEAGMAFIAEGWSDERLDQAMRTALALPGNAMAGGLPSSGASAAVGPPSPDPPRHTNSQMP